MSAEESRNTAQLTNDEVDALKGLVSITKLVQTQESVMATMPAQKDDDADGIDMVDLFWFLVYKLKYVVLAALVGALLGGVLGYGVIKPKYSATSKLYILGQNSAGIQISDLQLGSMLTLDYQEVFKTWEVHEMVRKALDLEYTYEEMQRMMTVSNPTNTRVLYITIQNGDPQLASDIANMYATAAKQFILQTMEAEEPNTFSMALVPSVAVGQSRSTYVILGFLMGAILLLAVFVCIYLLDDHPKSSEDILKATGLTTLAVIPLMGTRTKANKKEQKKRKGKR